VRIPRQPARATIRGELVAPADELVEHRRRSTPPHTSRANHLVRDDDHRHPEQERVANRLSAGPLAVLTLA